MASRPEEIMTTVMAAILGLTTTGTNVFRGRVYPLEDDEIPALTAYMGSDDPLGDNGPDTFTYLDSDLTVNVSIHVRSSTTQVETLLNTIRREVHVALMAGSPPDLSLSYVFQVIPFGTGEPQLSGEGDKRTAVLETNWAVRYRALVADLEV